MNKIEMNLLLSYNTHKRVNLITGTKYHAEKDLIYSVLYKRLEIAEIKELPMLIYNTSLDLIESQMLQIEVARVIVEEKKDSDQPEEG